MAYCPVCKYEYEPGIDMCPDCRVKLIERNSGTLAAVTPDESWVVMGTVSSQLQSDMAKGTLDSNNIPSVILSSGFHAFGGGAERVSGGSSPRSEGNIIMVPREFREDALLILESVLGDDLIQPGL